ncbi:GIY-YIG nuclease family protein [Candidatus Gracilibacteria bacterium]|nr:GIY-YIG nuclease family protein [Candidatus Gracilibacteria bacterium]
MYHTYILKCSDNTLYTGISTDLKRRIREHNGEISGGAKYTSNRQPVTLLYSEQFENRSDASKREHAIKKLSRNKKIELIHSKTDNKLS